MYFWCISFPLLWCFYPSWSWLHKLTVHTVQPAEVQEITSAHTVTSFISRLTLNIVRSALTQHARYPPSLPLHHSQTPQVGWLRDVSWPVQARRNRLKPLLLWDRLLITLPASPLPLSSAQKRQKQVHYKLHDTKLYAWWEFLITNCMI